MKTDTKVIDSRKSTTNTADSKVSFTIKTWRPEDAYSAYQENPVVKSVEATFQPKVSKALDRAIDDVLSQVTEFTTLAKGDWSFRGRDALTRLRNSLRHHAHGSKMDIQTLMFSQKVGDMRVTDRHAVVQECLSGIATPELFTEMEQSNLDKVASRSMVRPWGDIAALKVGAFTLNLLPQKAKPKAMQDAYAMIASLLPKRQLIPADWELAIGHIDKSSSADLSEEGKALTHSPMKLDTSSGPPYFFHVWYPSDYLKEVDPVTYKFATKIYQHIRSQADLYWKILSSADTDLDSLYLWAQQNFRTNDPKGEGDPLLKATRLVAGMIKWEALMWKRITIPFNRYLKLITLPGGIKPFASMMGSKYTDATVHALLRQAKAAGRTILCGDMTAFDNSKVQEISMKLVQTMLGAFRHEEVRRVYYNLAYLDYYRVCMAMPDRFILPTAIAQASGSGITLDGNDLMLLFLLCYGHCADAWRMYGFAVQGDDFLLDADGATPEVMEEVSSELGLQANASKQYYRKGSVEFLRCIHQEDYPGGAASIARAIGNMTAPENVADITRNQRPYFETVRALSQLHNLEFRQELVDVVEFVKAYDVNRLFENLKFENVVKGSGSAGEQLLMDITRENRKSANGVPATDWLVNRVRMGDRDIPPVNQRYPYVYGQSLDAVIAGFKEDVRFTIDSKQFRLA